MKEVLEAPTTGIVLRTVFENGAIVNPGDVVADMECMKMLFSITASRAGVITYAVEEQAFVQQGELVAEIQLID